VRNFLQLYIVLGESSGHLLIIIFARTTDHSSIREIVFINAVHKPKNVLLTCRFVKLFVLEISTPRGKTSDFSIAKRSVDASHFFVHANNVILYIVKRCNNLLYTRSNSQKIDVIHYPIHNDAPCLYDFWPPTPLQLIIILCIIQSKNARGWDKSEFRAARGARVHINRPAHYPGLRSTSPRGT